jgi:Ca2+:H+ antiporter
LACTKHGAEGQRDCRRCYFSQVPAVKDAFFVKAVQPYSWFSAVLLFLSYVIGLWFTLRTHAAVIWSTEVDEKKVAHLTHESALLGSKHQAAANGGQSAVGSNTNTKGSIRESQLYARILGHSLNQIGLAPTNADSSREQLANTIDTQVVTPHVVPPKSREAHPPNLILPGLSEEQDEMFVRQVAEAPTTAATVAARDASRSSRKPSISVKPSNTTGAKAAGGPASTVADDNDDLAIFAEPHSVIGGHDAPNWSKTKSSIILLVATLLYAVIAEILVNTVDVVLESVTIDEKFLGITLFALVPNTTEFLVSTILDILLQYGRTMPGS